MAVGGLDPSVDDGERQLRLLDARNGRRTAIARHYDGQAGHSTASAVLRAWVGAIGALSIFRIGNSALVASDGA